jgi:hypothetical protein
VNNVVSKRSVRSRQAVKTPECVSLNLCPLTASRRTTTSTLYAAQGSIGACIMDIITLVAFVASIYLAGRIAQRRGRSVKIWAWIAAFIGPLVFLSPNLHGKNSDHA